MNVTDDSDKTGDELLILSDVLRYNDAYRVMCGVYGDHNNKLPPNFGKLYPEIIDKYFSDIDAIPDPIRSKLGI